MKQLLSVLLRQTVTGAIFLVWCSSAVAVQKEWQEVVKQSRHLAETYRVLETKIAALELKLRVLERDFVGCSSGTYRVFLKATGRIADAEAERGELEKQNLRLRELNETLRAKNFELNAERASIEEKYRGRARGTTYDVEFREFMVNYHTNYVNKFELFLIPGYQSYAHGIELYMEVIHGSNEACKSPAGLIWEAFTNNAERTVDGIGKTVKSLRDLVDAVGKK